MLKKKIKILEISVIGSTRLSESLSLGSSPEFPALTLPIGVIGSTQLFESYSFGSNPELAA